MNKKSLLIFVLVIVFVGVAFFVWHKKVTDTQDMSKQQKEEEIQSQNQITESKKEDSAEPEFSPQHIVSIPGNTHQVWYEIPEMGIKLLLSKEAAEELVYKYGSKKDVELFGKPSGVEVNTKMVKDVESVTLSRKYYLEYDRTCSGTPGCGYMDETTRFSISKVPGTYHNEALAFGPKFLKQFSDFYLITGPSPQASPFTSEEEYKWFEKNILPTVPKVPSLQDIRIELLEGK